MGVVSSSMTPPPSTGHKRSLNDLMRMKSYAMAFPVTRSQANLTHMGDFWRDVRGSTLQDHHRNTNWQTIFWNNDVNIWYISRDLYNWRQGSLKLFWQHVVAQQLTKKHCLFFIIISFVPCIYCIHKNGCTKWSLYSADKSKGSLRLT